MQSRERRRSVVLACPSPYEVDATVANSLPFEEWPEIENRLGFYALPTIGAVYHSFPKPALVNEPWEKRVEMILDLMPFFKRYKTQLMPLLLTCDQSQEEECYNNDVVMALEVIGKFLLDDYAESIITESEVLEWTMRFEKEFGIRRLFSIIHETEHIRSLTINRPVTKAFKETAALLFDLLYQQKNPSTQRDFWDKFNELNDKLKLYLSHPFVLEELRANISTLNRLPPNLQKIVINKVFPYNQDDPDAQLLHMLRELTGERWIYAWYLTILVEFLDPADPLNALEKLQSTLNAYQAAIWSDEIWENFLDAWSELDQVDAQLKEDYGVLQFPKIIITGLPNNETTIACPDSMILKLFLESMRQQLGNINQIRSLICPYQRGRLSCCGFGHYLQAVWAGIPNEYRHRLEAPANVCSK